MVGVDITDTLLECTFLKEDTLEHSTITTVLTIEQTLMEDVIEVHLRAKKMKTVLIHEVICAVLAEEAKALRALITTLRLVEATLKALVRVVLSVHRVVFQEVVSQEEAHLVVALEAQHTVEEVEVSQVEDADNPFLWCVRIINKTILNKG